MMAIFTFLMSHPLVADVIKPKPNTDTEGSMRPIPEQEASTKFYVLRRNDGYTFIQRYVPANYGSTTFEKLGEFQTLDAAREFLQQAVL